MIDKKLCDRMKEVRLTLSKDDSGKPLSITDFAKKIAISRSAVSEVELYRREPSKNVIKKILEIYGVNIIEESTRSEKDTMQVQVLAYQLNDLKAENEFLRKENERLRQENTRLFLESRKPAENATLPAGEILQNKPENGLWLKTAEDKKRYDP